jgi:hypothetical protein
VASKSPRSEEAMRLLASTYLVAHA